MSAQSNAKYGDVNNDGQVNQLDVNAVSDIIMGKAASTESADVNKDTKINVGDIVAVVNAIDVIKKGNAELYAILLNPSITDADIFVYNLNGSYILLKKENESGYGWIHFNSSVENESKDGVTILIGEDGKPVMLTIPEGHIIFNNVTEDSFDFALIKPNEKLRIFRDMRIDDGIPKPANTRGFLDPWTEAWENLWYDIHNGWDEHNKKALLPYITKVLAMTLSTGGTFGVGFVVTVIVEGAKSMDKECIFTDILGTMGIFDLKSEDLSKFSLLSFGANKLANKQLEELGRMDELVGPNLRSDEWKIKLSKNPLECSYEEKWHTDVYVDSWAKWKIDDSNVDKNWCEVRTSSDQVLVHVYENKSIEDRSCSVVVSAEYTTEIESVVLKIKQNGNIFGLNPITLGIEEVGETTAKVCGKIEGYDLLDETVRFGLGYIEVGKSSSVGYDAHSLNDIGGYTVNFINLKPNTTYRYYAYLIIDGETYYGEHKEFTTKSDESGDAEAYIVRDGDTLIFYYDNKRKVRNNVLSNVLDWGEYKRKNYNTYITSDHYEVILDKNTKVVSFDPSFQNYTPSSTAYWFCLLSNLVEIKNLNYLNTSKVNNMKCMFASCHSLTSIDLSSFNTVDVTNMSSMFSSCSSLTSLDLSSFNTANVTDMKSMFVECSSLTTLDLSKFNTANVTNMYYMFSSCSSLTSLDLSNFNTSNVTNMAGMFLNNRELRTIYGNNWNVRNFINDVGMFDECDKLVGGKGSKWGENLYGYDNLGRPLYYKCYGVKAAHIDGGKDNPGLFTAK